MKRFVFSSYFVRSLFFAGKIQTARTFQIQTIGTFVHSCVKLIRLRLEKANLSI